jgi:adenine phosphoribosyltransferase
MDLSPLIRDVPDFPKPGIVFKDITPLLSNREALAYVVHVTAAHFAGLSITKVVGIESRGFICAPAVALGLGVGFVPVRKPGKLPWKCYEESYSLEYGADRLEVHVDALSPGDRVLLVDDVLATGGTMAAALRLVRKCGATPIGCAFLVDLTTLGGAAKLDVPCFAVQSF